MSDVLLINLTSYEEFSYGMIFPIGLVKIKSYICNRGYSCDILDFNLNPVIDLMEIINSNYKIIGVALRNLDSVEINTKVIYKKYITFVNNLYKLKSKYQKNFKLVLGGSAYSLYYQELNCYLNFDYGIVGNGENKIFQLINDDFPNKILYGFDRCLEQISYDELLVKAYLSKDPNTYIGIQTYEANCSKKCVYCSYNYKKQENFYSKSISNIMNEITQLKKMSVKNFFIVDPVFNYSDEYAIQVLEPLKDLLKDVNLCAFINPTLNRKLFLLLNKCNVFAIYSFDSFSNKILKELHKEFEVDLLRSVIKLSREYSIKFTCDILFGCREEDEQSVKETCLFINDNLKSKDELSVSFGIRLVPMSTLYNIAKKNKNFNSLEPSFVYFDINVIDYFYKYINYKFIDSKRFLKHLYIKKNYLKVNLVKIENK